MNHIDRQRASQTRCPSRARLQRWVDQAIAIAAPERAPVELTIRFVDRDEGRALNRDFRSRDYATNVLSFPADVPEFPAGIPTEALEELGQGRHIGDLVICVPVVQAEAAEQHKTQDAHFAHLVIHGVLHLLGHDHEIEAEAERMEALEARILAQLGYADPYVSEGHSSKRLEA